MKCSIFSVIVILWAAGCRGQDVSSNKIFKDSSSEQHRIYRPKIRPAEIQLWLSYKI
ncbi:hypothetical protein [Flavobacterium ginsengiterrae]|uniref:hypothetical protein n=1 Tax=Flavobacterium ginsengiterrae TaxID=871695 RepID=UPI0031F1220B